MAIAGVKDKETTVAIYETSIDHHLQNSIQIDLQSSINNENNPSSCNLPLQPLILTVDAIINTTTLVTYLLCSREPKVTYLLAI